MAIKNVDVSCLYRASSSARSVEIGSHSYAIGSSGMSGKSLYSGPRSTKVKTAKYSYSLLPFKYWTEDSLFVAKDTDRKTIYINYIDSYSDKAVQNKKALCKYDADNDKWTIWSGEFASPRTQAAYISVISAVAMSFFTSEYIADPLLFCDAIYYGYIVNHKNSFEIEDTPDPTIEDQARRAYESGLMDTVIGTSPFTEPVTTGFPEAETVKSSNPDFEPYLNGEKIIPYNWDEESKAKIVDRSYLEDFVPTEAFFSLAQKVCFRLGKVIERLDSGLTGKEAIGKDFLNIRLVGNPGSGKTVLGTALSAALGLPLYTVPIQKHSEEDTFEGKNKIVEGKLSFVDTDFLKAYKEGGIVILEEINLADPATTMGALGQAIEPPFVVNENGYKGITRHPMCIIIATQNVGTVGSKAVNQALVSRFPHTYVINDPTESEFVERLMSRYPDKSTCTWVYKSYSKIKEYLCSSKVSAEDIALALTFRACLGILEDIEEGASRRTALKKFHAIIYGESPEIAAEALTIINSLPGV